MAGHIRKQPNGRYLARFPLGGRGRFRSRTFDRKIDAEKWLRQQTIDRDRGQWPARARVAAVTLVTEAKAGTPSRCASGRSSPGATGGRTCGTPGPATSPGPSVTL